MNSADQVRAMIDSWKGKYTKEEIVQKAAEAVLGWPYVWGGYGQLCTPGNRKAYADRTSCPPAESAVIISKCKVLRSGKSSNANNECHGCEWYPGDCPVRFFDCRGLTGWLLQQIGFSLQGAGATSQWNTAANWSKKGTIGNMPMNTVCCVFWQDKTDPNVMAHTGMHIGGGVIIHDSGEVKYGKSTDRGWTHFAIPKCFEGGDVPVPDWRPTIRKGSSGEDVKYCQELLMKLGYDLSPYNADGRFGNKTLEAVKSFQRDHSLNQDGVVGPLTWDALQNAKPGSKLYTAKIPHLTEAQIKALKSSYPDLVSEVE